MYNWFVSILDWVYGWVINYGWSVVVFTVIIKVCLMPLDIKSRRSMRQMSALNPKLEELKKRYANDQEKLNLKTQELYKKSKVTPLAGCLPLLIQLPILYIMFEAMRRVAAREQIKEMAQWIMNNLAVKGEDGTWVWKSGLFDLITDEAGNQLYSWTDAGNALLNSIREGSMTYGNSQTAWLWIKNVFQPDHISSTVMPSLTELAQTFKSFQGKVSLTADELAVMNLYLGKIDGGNTLIASAIDAALREGCGYTTIPLIFNLITIDWPHTWTYVNGYLILPVLAGASQILAGKLQGTQDTSAQQSGSGKFMKWFFPILSVWICLSSNAAFAIYWVFVNLWSIVSNYAINLYLDYKEKNAAPKDDGSNTTKKNKEALQP